MAETKNLGQVSGLWIGTSAPTNTSIIWYDSTPAIRLHKVYNPVTSAWETLNKNAISAITYSVLKTTAQSTGLTQGAWFKITDKNNILALAITSTKVQYVDANNNFTIDDLAASAIYLVSSSNLLIDDIAGVWNATTKQLEFSFADTAQDANTANDYLFGKKQRNGVWALAKYKLSTLVSSLSGNSITWNRGFYFSFNSAISAIKDATGGIVGKASYDSDQAAMQQSIANVAAANQAIQAADQAYTDNKVVDAQIYGKKLPSAPTTVTANIAAGDTLLTIVSKVQTWINKFKTATNINLSQGFSPTTTAQDINNNDTVESAFQKVAFWRHNLDLSSSWAAGSVSSKDSDVAASDKYENAFAKIQRKFSCLGSFIAARIYVAQKAVSINNSGVYSGLNVIENNAQSNSVAFSAEVTSLTPGKADAYFPRLMTNKIVSPPKNITSNFDYTIAEREGFVVLPTLFTSDVYLPHDNLIDGTVVTILNKSSNAIDIKIYTASGAVANTAILAADAAPSNAVTAYSLPAYAIRTFIYVGGYATGIVGVNNLWIAAKHS